MGKCVCLFVGCGRCVPLDNRVPKCAVDFMVLLGKVGVFGLQMVVVGMMFPGWFWVVMVCLMCFGCLSFSLFMRFVGFFLCID